MKFIENIRYKWDNIRLAHKYTFLLFVQVWFWPQVFDSRMQPNIMLPLSITACAAFALNLVKMINAYEDEL